jgi:hypothetical protein
MPWVVSRAGSTRPNSLIRAGTGDGGAGYKTVQSQ